MTEDSAQSVESVLLRELARGNAAFGTLTPILRHLLISDGHGMLSDEIVARVRGMLGDLAGQLLLALAAEGDSDDIPAFVSSHREGLFETLLDNLALLGHVHALALEWQLSERLQTGGNADPVLSPLLQELIGSDDADMAGLAMMVLAAQARFVQAQRRMELPLTELPGDLFHAALIAMQAHVSDHEAEPVAQACDRLRASFDESRGRLGLVARLVVAMGADAVQALAIDHAGAAIFLTALALGSEQDRDLAVLATNERQLARLALSLRASGIDPRGVEAQFLTLHPDRPLPPGLDQLAPDSAAALLLSASVGTGER